MPKTNIARKQLLKEIEGLSEERVKLLADLVAFLKEREEWEATFEILGNTELTEVIQSSRQAWKEGRKEEFVPHTVRRLVAGLLERNTCLTPSTSKDKRL